MVYPNRLYRQKFPTFEAYCRERWGLKERRAYQLLDAAEVVKNLGCTMVQPTTERQARPLTRLEPESGGSCHLPIYTGNRDLGYLVAPSQQPLF